MSLRDLARWLFLASLVYAPWAYGCTHADTIRWLNLILAVALGLGGLSAVISYWLVVGGRSDPPSREATARQGSDPPSREATAGQKSEVRSQRSDVGSAFAQSYGVTGGEFQKSEVRGQRSEGKGQRPDNHEPITNNSTVPRWAALLAPSVVLLILGWWMAFNARWIYDSEFFLFVPRKAWFGSGPGSIDFTISVSWMVRATLLLGVMFFAATFARRPVWLLRLWWSIAVAGGSIAFLGLAQKATAAPMIFWEPADPPRTTFFATYYAHANAGAYLNLVLPVVVTLTLRNFLKKGAAVERAISLVLCLLTVIAAISNTSRGGHVVTLFIFIALSICLRDLLMSRARGFETRKWLVAAIVVGLAVIAIAGVSQLNLSVSRWHSVIEGPANNSRWQASRAAFGALGDAGWFGFGPGTFRVAFPYYTNGFGSTIGGVWRFLHQDYLQTLMEWGWLGSACWAVLFFGAIWSAVVTLRRRKLAPLTGRQRLFLTGAVVALGGVALHALVDFPLQIASLQLYVATYVGVCWGLRPQA
jgi:hypothetical protein